MMPQDMTPPPGPGTEDATEPGITPIGSKAADKTAKVAKLRGDRSVVTYQAADKEEVDALWAKFGRDRVKGLEGFRSMTLGQIANALK